jgi:hypothetical protein
VCAGSTPACQAARLLTGAGCGGRYRDQRDRPDLTNPESLQLYLETRFEQLKVRGAPPPAAAPAARPALPLAAP